MMYLIVYYEVTTPTTPFAPPVRSFDYRSGLISVENYMFIVIFVQNCCSARQLTNDLFCQSLVLFIVKYIKLQMINWQISDLNVFSQGY